MKMQVSFWNYSSLQNFDRDPADTVKEWRELGITVGFSPVYESGKDDKKKMLDLISECEKQGIKLIIFDKRVYSPCDGFDEKAYEHDVREAVSDFGTSSAVAAFYVGDEPRKADFARYLKAVRIVQSCGAKAFMNFSWCDAHLKDFADRNDYADYLKNFVKESGLGLVSNDRYSCLHAKEFEPGFLELGTDKYFADLNLFRGVADSCGVPFWTSLCSVGHWMYRTPTEADIRWQINTALAHGAVGIQWFFIYQHRFADDYYSYPVDIYGGKSETYRYLARHCRTLNDHTCAELGDFQFSRVWHIVKSYGNTPLLKENDADIYVYTDHGMKGILSEFRKGDQKKYLIVNSEREYPELYYIRYEGGGYHIWLPAGGAHVVSVGK